MAIWRQRPVEYKQMRRRIFEISLLEHFPNGSEHLDELIRRTGHQNNAGRRQMVEVVAEGLAGQQGIRSWKCRIPAASDLGIEMPWASQSALPELDHVAAVVLWTVNHDAVLASISSALWPSPRPIETSY